MPVSGPLKVMSLKLTPEERARLEQIAGDRKLGLSEVLREGLRLVAEDHFGKGGGRRARTT